MSRLSQNQDLAGKAKSITSETDADAPLTNGQSGVTPSQETISDNGIDQKDNAPASTAEAEKDQAVAEQTVPDSQNGDAGNSSQTDTEGEKTAPPAPPHVPQTQTNGYAGQQKSNTPAKKEITDKVWMPISLVNEIQQNAPKHAISTPMGLMFVSREDTSPVQYDGAIIIFGPDKNKKGKQNIRLYMKPSDPADLAELFGRVVMVFACAIAGNQVPQLPWGKVGTLYTSF
jgi:hypothetical protein